MKHGITPLENWIARRLKLADPLSISRLREYQAGKLRETLEHVLSCSRFYRELLKGINPASVRSLDDISKLPFTEPAMLAGHFGDFLCVSPKNIGRIVTLRTSGTTGHPKRIAFTFEDQELTIDFFNYGMTTFADSADRVLIFLPGETEGSVGDLLLKGLARFGCEGTVFGPISDFALALEALRDTKATCAVGIPTQLLALSRFEGAQGIRLKSVLLSTDHAAGAIADSLSQAWGCDVYDHYGMTEMGLGGAVECRARNGYHMREADLLFEIIDPETGKPVSDGGYGEVVFSTLTRRGMPLVRYRTGDISRFLVQPCGCGSVLRRLERISGRIGKSVRLRCGSSLSINQLDEILFRNPCLSSYSAQVRSNDHADCLVLNIRSARQAVDIEEISDTLCRHSCIGDHVKHGELKLHIREEDVQYFTTGTSKRFIADLRVRADEPI